MAIYNSNMNTLAYKCLNRLTIARITAGKDIDISPYTEEQRQYIKDLQLAKKLIQIPASLYTVNN